LPKRFRINKKQPKQSKICLDKGGRLKITLPQPKPAKTQCPKCGSSKAYCDGTRKLVDGTEKQRYLCRECYHRYTYPPTLKRTKDKLYLSQISALKEAKNLEPQTENNTVVGESLQDSKSKIIEFAWQMKKEGYKEGTIISRTKLLKVLVKRGANLYEPETIKEVIAKQNSWSEGRKENAVNAYSTFLKIHGGTWTPPIYSRIHKIPFIPKEEEIDTLIASCTTKAATLLQTLKETAARVGEAWMLQWTDLDTENRTLRITPEKGSNPRIFKISQKLLSMLLSMPRNGNSIFGTYPLSGYRTCFTRQRKKAATKLGNPRLLQITFHTFRHWKATMEYHKTKDIIYVMKLLGHKSIKNTLVYTQLIDFDDNEQFVCKAAKTVQEASTLIESGFEYVCSMEDIKLFRKRA
jgi:integrase/CDGSH-type Zn-finger protein